MLHSGNRIWYNKVKQMLPVDKTSVNRIVLYNTIVERCNIRLAKFLLFLETRNSLLGGSSFSLRFLRRLVLYSCSLVNLFTPLSLMMARAELRVHFRCSWLWKIIEQSRHPNFSRYGSLHEVIFVHSTRNHSTNNKILRTRSLNLKYWSKIYMNHKSLLIVLYNL